MIRLLTMIEGINEMGFWGWWFHRCIILERSSKGLTGMILKCKDCGRRFKIDWDDYKKMHKGVKLSYEPTQSEE